MLVVGLFFGCTATRPAGGPKPVEPTLVTTGETTETGSGAGTLGDFPAPFAADYLWATLTFDDATDFGFVPSEIPLAETVEPGPVVLVEHASEAGLGASVVGGDTHGVGVGAFDVDGDGWDDIFVASGVGAVSYSSAVWHNNGDGTFSDGSEVSGVLAALAGVDAYSVAAADYDADGDFDVYVGAIPYGILLRNDGGVLSDVTGAANAAGPESVTPGGVSKIAAWGDYDNDGWLDLVAASSTFTTAPENGYLLRNQGDGTFADVSTATALQFSGEGNPCAVLWTDYDNDGDLDLNVWNDRGGAFTNRSLLRKGPRKNNLRIRTRWHPAALRCGGPRRTCEVRHVLLGSAAPPRLARRAPSSPRCCNLFLRGPLGAGLRFRLALGFFFPYFYRIFGRILVAHRVE